MPGPRNARSKKGFFSDVRLPVAKEYVYPHSRRFMFLLGGGGVALIILVFSLDLAFQRGTLISNGPLSSNHATFGEDCASCHSSFRGVTDEKCATCHEKFSGALGVHTLAAHYQYRSSDTTRTAPAGADEPACHTCHTEHEGRDAQITVVADANCAGCHGIDAFHDGHPEFSAVAAGEQATGLLFPHALHIPEIQSLAGTEDVEQSCLYCHNPGPMGGTFQPIDFQQHCADCHLGTGESTDWLPLASAGVAGVLTLQTLRAQGTPDLAWSQTANPEAFRQEGNQVRKRPLEHPDPWVMYNLARAQRFLAASGPALSPAELSGYRQLVPGLTRACQQCHVMDGAALLPVPPDQRLLKRAEFDHGAHVIVAGCLDCHQAIPIPEILAGTGDASLDVASVVNLPGIASCQTCHTRGKAADTCITCHLFHPEASPWAGMQHTASH